MAKTPSVARRKINTVMDEFDAGTLKSSSGAPVKSRDQALAIAMSEARKADREHAPPTPKKTLRRRRLSH